MKTQLTALAILLLSSVAVNAQSSVPDQNPNYAISRDKYMKMADSLNKWHGTTLQNTYEANDWLANRLKARKDRVQFRRMLRLERARWNGYDYRNDGYFYPSYNYNNYQYNPYSNYRNNRWQRSRFWWW